MGIVNVLLMETLSCCVPVFKRLTLNILFQDVWQGPLWIFKEVCHSWLFFYSNIEILYVFRRHIYIPMGGNRQGRMRRQVASLTSFAFVLLWHGVTNSIMVWVVVNFVALFCEEILLINAIITEVLFQTFKSLMKFYEQWNLSAFLWSAEIEHFSRLGAESTFSGQHTDTRFVHVWNICLLGKPRVCLHNMLQDSDRRWNCFCFISKFCSDSLNNLNHINRIANKCTFSVHNSILHDWNW